MGIPLIIFECKASKVAIDQKVIEQISVYNKTIGAAYLCVSNGLKHYCWTLNEIENKFEFLQQIPDFKEISS
jgi:type I site-specific restriction-modification system R (restriction) subunit